VVDWVHGHTAGLWAYTLPTVTTGLTDLHEFVLSVTNFANGCAAIDWNATHFGRWHTQCCEFAIFSNELHCHTCRASDLATLARTEFHVVDHGTDWDVTHWKRVTRLDVCVLSARYVRADFETLWREDV
jgi:hypothetical protein